MYKFLSLIIICALLTSLTSCSTKIGRLFTVYKIDVQQGNAVEPEKVRQLEIGMTKNQVEYLMGTPLVTDVFHPDRWDYIYYLIPDYGERERRHVAVFFEGDKVAKIEEDDIPPPEVAAQEDEALIEDEEKHDGLQEEVPVEEAAEDLGEELAVEETVDELQEEPQGWKTADELGSEFPVEETEDELQEEPPAWKSADDLSEGFPIDETADDLDEIEKEEL